GFAIELHALRNVGDDPARRQRQVVVIRRRWSAGARQEDQPWIRRVGGRKDGVRRVRRGRPAPARRNESARTATLGGNERPAEVRSRRRPAWREQYVRDGSLRRQALREEDRAHLRGERDVVDIVEGEENLQRHASRSCPQGYEFAAAPSLEARHRGEAVPGHAVQIEGLMPVCALLFWRYVGIEDRRPED